MQKFFVVVVYLLSHVWLFATPWTVGYARLLCPWDFPGKNTGVGCCFLLQGIFWTKGSNLSLLHCRWILYHLATREAPSSAQERLQIETAFTKLKPALFKTSLLKKISVRKNFTKLEMLLWVCLHLKWFTITTVY